MINTVGISAAQVAELFQALADGHIVEWETLAHTNHTKWIRDESVDQVLESIRIGLTMRIRKLVERCNLGDHITWEEPLRVVGGAVRAGRSGVVLGIRIDEQAPADATATWASVHLDSSNIRVTVLPGQLCEVLRGKQLIEVLQHKRTATDVVHAVEVSGKVTI